MKTLFLTLSLLFLITLPTSERDIPLNDMWCVGRFVIIEDDMGYYAVTEGKTSNHYLTAISAIRELRELD